jgi:peptidoglycan hydrolase CwlO-like protein
MASNAGGLAAFVGVIGGVVALDTITKKQTAIQRLTQDGHAKDATIRSLHSQVTNEQAIRQNLQAMCNEKDAKIRALDSRLTMVAEDRDDARAQLETKKVELSSTLSERDTAKRRVAELEAEVARLKAAQPSK